MAQKYKIRNLLKNLPFYSEKIKSSKKITKNLVISSFYLNYHFSIKNLKNYLISNHQKHYQSHQSYQKDLKD